MRRTRYQFTQKASICMLILLTGLSIPSFGLGLNDDPFGDYFTHTATTENIDFNYTVIDHPLLNDNPNAIVMATQNWNPGGGEGGIYNDHAIGVWYTGSRWSIFNQDIADMPENASFNIVVPSSAAIAFVHAATTDNIAFNYTVIDHPLLNGNPNANVMVTQNWNPDGGEVGVYNDHKIGVWYDGSKWAIFNQDIADMTENASFNVLINGESATTFVQTATTDNIAFNWTVIDHPLTNGKPDAFVTVTQNWNPGGVGDVYNDHAVGVWYDGSNWAIFNQDEEAMPENAAFNVSVLNVKPEGVVHAATTDNIVSNWTVIDNPATNGNPNAIVIATQNWNPGGLGGTYNDHNIGVWYDGSKWAIFNQDIASMVENASFSVLIPGSASATFVHTADESNTVENYTLLDHPSLNGNPNAIVQATQNWNPGGVGDVYNDHPIGVWYTGTQWSIYNQDIAAIPAGASFNILVLDAGTDVFVHTASAGNIVTNSTAIDHPLTNNHPEVLLHVTQNWNPGGVGEIYNNHEVGVWYDGSKWNVFNQDLTNMTEGASFNVLVYGTADMVVSNEDEDTIPDTYRLSQNYPNPFNPSTTISYQVPSFEEVNLSVYNLIGQKVQTLVSGPQAAGVYEVSFDGSGLSSGTYIYRLSAGAYSETRVMVLLK